MILLLVWVAGLAAIAYESWKRGALPLIAAMAWVWVFFLWAVGGAWLVAKFMRRPRLPGAAPGAWQKAVAELARRDAEKQRAEREAP